MILTASSRRSKVTAATRRSSCPCWLNTANVLDEPVNLRAPCLWPGVRRAGRPRKSPPLTPGQRRRKASP